MDSWLFEVLFAALLALPSLSVVFVAVAAVACQVPVEPLAMRVVGDTAAGLQYCS